MSLLTKIFGDPNEKYIKNLQPLIAEIRELGKKYERLSDRELKNLASGWKAKVAKSKKLDELLSEVFAATREAARRQMGSGHFDVQMIGACILHEGKIAEMKTGEGKTSYAVSPAAALNALAGQGVHIVTVNDYLSKRDASWIGGVYAALGLSVGVIAHEQAYVYNSNFKDTSNNDQANSHSQSPDSKQIPHSELQVAGSPEDNLKPVSRKEAYACDITYGTNNEFGFDYLRDNMAQRLEDKVQRGWHFAVIDEVDSILIDEARTPLIISAPAEEAAEKYRQFAGLIPRLQEGADYNIDEKMRAATLTEGGIKKMEDWLGVENIYTAGGIGDVHHIEQALKAQALFQCDKDYVVKDGEIIIVDEFTGRLMQGRRYSEGLHQAIEAKEGVAIKQESITMATVTFQNYFRMYEKLAGMTGTAATEAEEFSKIYGLDVLVVPTNEPLVRIDRGDLIYKNEAAKFKAVIDDIRQRQVQGQPVLVGTISIEKNEYLSHLLEQEGIEHNILNAKNHLKEAQFIAEAGQKGKVTLATNMAGRGVDIKLGGENASRADYGEIKKLGGLYVIGTERHESRRIDNQLRGRSGRQGDPGESRFYVSLEDDLMRIFGSDRLKILMKTLPDDMPIEHQLVSKSLEAAQKKVEGHNFDIRKHLLEYDDVINKHREVIYRKRDRILGLYEKFKRGEPGITNNSQDLEAVSRESLVGSYREMIVEMVEDELERVVMFHTRDDDEQSWNIDEIYEVCDTIFPLPLEVRLRMDDVQKSAGDKIEDARARDKLINYLIGLAGRAYTELEERVNKLGSPEQKIKAIHNIEKMVLLRSIDALWVEHIDAIDHLRTGIGLRGYGQKDPLVEYKREAYRMFIELQNNITKQVVYSIFKIGQPAPIRTQNAVNREHGLIFKGADKTGNQESGIMNYGIKNDSISQAQPAKVGEVSSSYVQAAPVEKKQKIGRNDPCPCGATKPDGTRIKFKYCHGK